MRAGRQGSGREVAGRRGRGIGSNVVTNRPRYVSFGRDDNAVNSGAIIRDRWKFRSGDLLALALRNPFKFRGQRPCCALTLPRCVQTCWRYAVDEWIRRGRVRETIASRSIRRACCVCVCGCASAGAVAYGELFFFSQQRALSQTRGCALIVRLLENIR